jgi:hypothetical protein
MCATLNQGIFLLVVYFIHIPTPYLFPRPGLPKAGSPDMKGYHEPLIRRFVMYLNRVCPLVNKPNQVAGGKEWQCNEPSCRFQINGVCAIIGSFAEAKDNRKILNTMSQSAHNRL